MNPGRYFMPNMAINPMMIRNGYSATRGMGLLGRLTQGLRAFNWNRLLSGANKTLNVMNQTIPLVRQAKPMVNNVKNMLNLAKAFRNETTNNTLKNNNIRNDKVIKNNNIRNDKVIKNNNKISLSKNEVIINKNSSDMPTFFI